MHPLFMTRPACRATVHAPRLHCRLPVATGMRFARASDSANRWHGVTRLRSQVDADTEASRGFRATEGAAEVDAHAIIECLRIADRQRRTPILEAHARSQATIAAGAGASHGHLHRGRGHRPLAADAIIGAIAAILPW